MCDKNFVFLSLISVGCIHIQEDTFLTVKSCFTFINELENLNVR